MLAGGAADAAFGDLPVPGRAARSADTATYRVPDSRLAELATIEFVPPRGLEPWQAAAVLREEVDDDTVAAWFSEMIATDALTISDDDGEMQLRRGPNTGRLSAVDQGHLQRLFGSSDVVELGSYDPGFTATWAAIKAEQRSFVGAAGWWSRGGPGGRVTTPARVVGLLIAALLVVALVVFVVTVAGTNFWLAVSSLWLALIAGFLVPFVVAAAMYRPMFPARTATGSALALRSESFRRFLAASEGKHVEWAWEHGLLREYERVGSGVGCRRRLGRCDPLVEHRRPPDRSRRAVARAFRRIVVPLIAHRPLEFRWWWRWRRRRRRRRRWRQFGFVVKF